VLCIRRTLADGRVTGLAVGLGAAAADAVYGAIAGFGLTAVSSFLVRQQGLLRLVGGLFLTIWACARSWRVRLATRRAGGRRPSRRVHATFGLTRANPATSLSFVTVFAGLGIAGAGSWREATVLVAGVFVGSALWWLMLSGADGALRSRADLRALRWINRVSGAGAPRLRHHRAAWR
jgi:threonine/homoserine/homoserine lactone efflux protein